MSKPSSSNSWHDSSGTEVGGVCAQFSMHCPLLTVAIDLLCAPSAIKVRHEDVSEALPPAGWMLPISTYYTISSPYPQRWNLAGTWRKSPTDSAWTLVSIQNTALPGGWEAIQDTTVTVHGSPSWKMESLLISLHSPPEHNDICLTLLTQ